MLRFLMVSFVFLASVVHAAPPKSANPRIGTGILLGEPTGFSLELELNQTHALDGAVSYSLVDGALHLHSDYLFRVNPYAQTHDLGLLVPYVGLGAQVAVGEKNDAGLSVRIPVGVINFSLKRRLGVFLEIVPGMAVLPATELVLGGALGARYYF